MSRAVTDQALALWGMQGARATLVAARENRVFKVEGSAQPAALRLHRPGYRSDAELTSELAWLQAAARGGIRVPAPLPTPTGALLQHVDGVQVSLLGWLGGAPLGQSNRPLDTPDRCGIFHAIGHEMARLHEISDHWQQPDGFTRVTWDSEGLLGDAPLWGRFWENPTLAPADRSLFKTVRDEARNALSAHRATLDTGLIHADLVRENIMVENGNVQLIDFDDGGFGFRLFDIATALFKNQHEPDYSDLHTALIAGYRSVRQINTRMLDLFVVLRAMTYVGWIVPRMNETGAAERNARFVAQARSSALSYLAV